MSDPGKMRVEVVGCGDVAHRRYLPALTSLRKKVEIVACSDASSDTAAGATAAVADWSPGASAHT